MRRSRKQLLVRIEQGDSVIRCTLGRKDTLTVGQSPDNDITLYGDAFPRKHVLFDGRNNHFELHFNELMRGELVAGESRLRFEDVVAHDLLPRKRGHFSYSVTQGRKGIVQVGDAKITFQCADATEVPAPASMPNFKGFSWTYTTLRQFGRDWQFKLIFVALVFVHVLALRFMSGLPDPTATDSNARRVIPKRLAKIIVRKSEAELARERRGATAAAGEEEGRQAENKRKRGEKSERNVAPESQGLLGLLTGTGSSSQSNELADFLLDKGLVEELDEVVASTDLSIGQGSSKRNDDFDALIAQNTEGGGIDDILEDVGDVESVSLGEKGQIEVAQIGGSSEGSDDFGKRSEDSVRKVLRRYTGRLTYIYNKYLKHNPDLRGKMVVEVAIAADGSVARATLLTSSMQNADFEREILNFVRRWKYDPIDRGEVTVTYPLFFSKAG